MCRMQVGQCFGVLYEWLYMYFDHWQVVFESKGQCRNVLDIFNAIKLVVTLCLMCRSRL
jgi:hypothetical protein